MAHKKHEKWIWNPKNIGVRKSANGDHENDVWLYMRGVMLEIVVQTNLNGRVLGTTTHRVRLPNPKRKLGERAQESSE
jgi:hypothetical protein